MKVAMLDPSLFTLPYDRELCAALTRAGHAIRLYGRPLRPGETTTPIPDTWVPHFYHWSEGLRGRGRGGRAITLLKGLEHVAGMDTLTRALRHRPPDVIHIQWLPLPVIDRAFLRRLRETAPLVYTVHDTHPFLGSPTSSLQTVGWGAVLGSFDTLIVHSDFSRHQLLRWGVVENRVARIPMGLLPFVDARPPSRRSSADGRQVVLFFGTLKPYKGIDVLLRSFAMLPGALRARTELRIAGAAFMPIHPLLRIADKLGIAPQIRWDLRHISDGDAAALLDVADVVVLPYREIDASAALMSIIPAGKPLVVTSVGGLAELIVDGVQGYVVPHDDPPSLATALERILSDPSSARRMGEEVRRLAEALPTWDTIAGLTAAAYAQARDCWMRQVRNAPGL